MVSHSDLDPVQKLYRHNGETSCSKSISNHAEMVRLMVAWSQERENIQLAGVDKTVWTMDNQHTEPF